MVEYHGWITIAESPHEIDEGRLHEIAREARALVDRLRHPNRIAIMDVVNGMHTICVGGCPNHWSPDLDEVLELYSWLAAEAPGSYGLLYTADSDSPCGDFRVWRLARGTISEHGDPFLSPRAPTVEDPYDESVDE